MKKVISYEVRTIANKIDPYTIYASDMSLTGALINFVAEEEVSKLNPFPKKYVVKSFSVHTIISITPTYEESEEKKD